MERKRSSLKSHLVLIVDLSPTTHLLKLNTDNGRDKHTYGAYEQWLNSVIAFCSTHLLMNQNNKIHVIGSHFVGNDLLHPCKDVSPASKSKNFSGQYELFSKLSTSIHDQIQASVRKCRLLYEKHYKSGAPEEVSPFPLISGALAIGMCCIQRHKNDVESSRIAIITANSYETTAFSSQYMNFMNSFFTAQKLGINIDACVIGQGDLDDTSGVTSIFQQGCDLTGGLYLRVSNVNAFLEYLIWTMLPDVDLRSKLVLPTQKKISYKAACFCHRTMIDVGYVCSVCLSIFCSFTPICSTCHTVYKLPNIPLLKPKKKMNKAQS